MKGRLDVAEDIALWYKKLFADDFYLEIQDHGSIEDRIVNVELLKIGKKHQIKSSLLMMPTTYRIWMSNHMMLYFVY